VNSRFPMSAYGPLQPFVKRLDVATQRRKTDLQTKCNEIVGAKNR